MWGLLVSNISSRVEAKREGPADGGVVCQHEAGHSVRGRDVRGGARESNLSWEKEADASEAADACEA